MDLLFDRDKTAGLLSRMRDRHRKSPMKQFVKMDAKVEFVRDHIMVAKIRNGRFEVFTDEPAEYGGDDLAIAPLEYFVAGYALCEAAQYLWAIADMDLDVKSIEWHVKTRNSWSPVMPADKTDTSEFKLVTMSVSISSDEPRERIVELARQAEAQCPARQSLMRPIDVRSEITLNGEDLQ